MKSFRELHRHSCQLRHAIILLHVALSSHRSWPLVAQKGGVIVKRLFQRRFVSLMLHRRLFGYQVTQRPRHGANVPDSAFGHVSVVDLNMNARIYRLKHDGDLCNENV